MPKEPKLKAQKSCPVVLLLLILIGTPLFSQVCSQAKYSNTIACLPTVVAYQNSASELFYFDASGTLVWNSKPNAVSPIAVPLGLGAQYASQVATSPSAATSAGYIFTFEKGALTNKPADLGPLLSDLPQTIGKHRLYVGASYQWIEFSKTGGKDLKSFTDEQGYQDDYEYGWHGLQASASLKMHNIDTYLYYGVTDRLDVSAVIPWSRVAMSFHSHCLANDANQFQSDGATYCFTIGDTGYTYQGFTVYDAFIFAPNSGSRSSSGIGDVTLRAKYELLKRSRQGLALGLEYRLPTGDPLNLKGSGATGVRPFLAWGHNGRISPHANVGFQYNGSSFDDVRDNLDPSTFAYSNKLTSNKLPNTFTFSAGADFALNRRFDFDADLLDRVFSNDGSKGFQASFPAGYGNTALPVPVGFNGVKDKSTVILGAKGRLASHILFGASVMIDATNNGLSYKPSPIATLSYDFGKGDK